MSSLLSLSTRPISRSGRGVWERDPQDHKDNETCEDEQHERRQVLLIRRAVVVPERRTSV